MTVRPAYLRIIPLFALAAAALLAVPDVATAGSLPEIESRIFYHCSPGPGFDICSVKSDGSAYQQLTNDSAEDSVPKVSPDGQKLVWERDVLELWMMNPDGTGKEQLLEDLIFNPDSPTWSPDGQQIAFICNDPDDLNTHGICTINRDGTGFQMIETIEPRPTYLEWSPDGQHMLIENAITTGNEDLFVWNIQSGQLTNVTQTDAEWEHGTWSPDGQTIAFVGTPLPADGVSLTGLYTINPDGTGRTRIFTPDWGSDATNPAYSPNGNFAAFFCSHSDVGAPEVCIVRMASPSAGNLVDLLQEDFTDEYYLGNSPDWAFTGGPIFGDLDCDGDVDFDDALLLLGFLGGVSTGAACVNLGTEVELDGGPGVYGDLTCDQLITGGDALALFAHKAGTEVLQEPDCPPLGRIADMRLLG